MVLDGGPCTVGLESTIVSLIDSSPVLLRPGAVTFEELKALLPDLKVQTSLAAPQQPLSPGLLREHYAPATPIALRNTIKTDKYPKRVGLIAFSNSSDRNDDFDYSAVTILSQEENLTEIAAKLFAAIREQDLLGLDLIVVDSCSEAGLGRAIMDRLLRATAKFS